MIAQRYAGETSNQFIDFEVTMVPCVSVTKPTTSLSELESSSSQQSNSVSSDNESSSDGSSSIDDDSILEYQLGSDRLTLPSVDVQVLNCTNSHLSLFYGGEAIEISALPPGFSVLNTTDSL